MYIFHITAKNIFMNQILNLENKLNTKPLDITLPQNNKTHSSNKKKFIIILVISIIILVISLIYIAYNTYIDYKKSNLYLSQNAYDISKLYLNSTASQSYIKENDTKLFSIIGIIKIDKIKISYPILDRIDDELLKISPCKFSGPNINEIRKFLYCCSQL